MCILLYICLYKNVHLMLLLYFISINSELFHELLQVYHIFVFQLLTYFMLGELKWKEKIKCYHFVTTFLSCPYSYLGHILILYNSFNSLFRLAACSSGRGAVSYTHLDVYKRQHTHTHTVLTVKLNTAKFLYIIGCFNNIHLNFMC